MPQTDGGYLGPDIHTFVSAVFSGAAGVYIFMLDRDAGISALLTVTPGQSVSVTGDPSFTPVPSGPWSQHPAYNMRDAPLWGTGSFAVQERGSLALTRIALDASASITMSGGSLSLASMAVPAAARSAVEHTLSGAGSTLRLDAVTMPEFPSVGARTGMMTVGADGSKTVDPPNWGAENAPTFTVSPGHCPASGGAACSGAARGTGAARATTPPPRD